MRFVRDSLLWRHIVLLILTPTCLTSHYQDAVPRLFSLEVVSSTEDMVLKNICSLGNCTSHTTPSFVDQDLQSSIIYPHGNQDQTSQKQWREPGKNDGIVIQVMNEVTLANLITKTFNTWHPFTYAKYLVWWLEQVQPGRVVTMSIHRSGTAGLSPAIPFLVSLGSVLIPYAPPDALWMWVFIKGGKTLLESLSSSSKSFQHANLSSHMYLQRLQVPLYSLGNLKTFVYSNICSTCAAIRSVCDDEYLGRFVAKRNLNINTHKAGILLSAGGNIQHLAYTLHRLFSNPEIIKSMILVTVGTDYLTGKPNSSILSLLGILKINYKIIHVPSGAPSINHHLFMYYQKSWEAAVATFPEAEYLAFLDEDVEVSSDWFALLMDVAPALEKDSSLWCVSGTSVSHRFIHSDPQILLRASRQPGWGFLFQMSSVKEAVSLWPKYSNVSVLYDSFLFQVLAKGRECIYPVLSRARHYGVGVNTVPQIHQLYFLDLPLHNGKHIRIPPIDTLTWDSYEKRVTLQLQKAVPLTREPCAPGFLMPSDFEFATDYVFYFYMDSLSEAPEWTILAECIGAWPYSTQGMHRGSVELPQQGGGSLWLVGVPFSPYSSLKPSHVPVWRPEVNEAYLTKQMMFIASLYLPKDLGNRTLEKAELDIFQKHS
ncbi:protein O-linked-mannose beta-1,2-N-acetylglucosaminyltransferase 1-like [Macrobrachium rosenbergii]|uniref:protein O-linked-mannose beta-1,2-N-acetylglucosaminyltransferase 1-like n=1 Tax=Macrobrachium rosenbergii TaxID=79674 RepID=UPI0034D3D658